MNSISSFIWNDDFWLPDGYTWKDLHIKPGDVQKPQFSDLYYVPFIALGLVLIRLLFERYIALPFCLYLGIRNNFKHVEPNAICEKVFNEVSKSPQPDQVKGLAKQLGWTNAKVERWFRKKRKSQQVTLLKKATESCWRCIFYFWLFCFGAVTILPTDWFYNTRLWMEGYIHKQDFNNYSRSYYLMELGFYFSLLFSQFIDAKRKDFYQMFVHHVVTILLIFSSFAIAQHRIGVVIMFIHDASDFWLEAAKVFNYAKMQKFCDSLFVIFAIVFFLTRWIYYPFWVLDAFLLKCPKIIGPWKGHILESAWLVILQIYQIIGSGVLHSLIYSMCEQIGYFTAYYYFSTLLITLQILHIYWGGLIVHMVYKLTVYGKVDRDTRSEDESSGDEKENHSTNHTNSLNKKKK